MSVPETLPAPEASQVRVRRLIQALARRIQSRRLASLNPSGQCASRPTTPAVPGTLDPSGAPRAAENRTPPTSPPSPAQSAPSTLLRRLVADRPRPPRQRKVRA